jgi:hypothetical protein
MNFAGFEVNCLLLDLPKPLHANITHCLRFEFLTAVKTSNVIFWE